MKRWPIRRHRDGRLFIYAEATPGFPVNGLVQRKLLDMRTRILPADLFDLAADDHDAVLTFVAGHPGMGRVLKQLRIRVPTLESGAYWISPRQIRGRRLLVVAGGDVFGMLAGLSEALEFSEERKTGISYLGGPRHETPAFPLRYYWTWDHRMQWVMDDPGFQVHGCTNPYTRRPETFVEDYRRLVDHCIDTRVNAIAIWGFLRDAHGGEAFAGDVARYAADRGVAILPGAGVTGYGGMYYEGDHPANLETLLRRHPERGQTTPQGSRNPRCSTPYDPKNIEWISRTLEWLYRTFPIGGVNLENMDIMVDHSQRARQARARLRTGEADHFKDQYFAYHTALKTAHRVAPQAWNTYATYSSFSTGKEFWELGDREPTFASGMPDSAMAQWSVTRMLRRQSVPLRAWMEKPRPAEVYDNPHWPEGLVPPTPRSCGFAHLLHPRGRRWDHHMSRLAELCLRSHESGLEGMGVYGEMAPRWLPERLSYLAFRHWSYHPGSTLGSFAASELAPRLRSEKGAQDFAELLCRLDESPLGGALETKCTRHMKKWQPCNNPVSGNADVFRWWDDLLYWNNMLKKD